MPVLWAPAGRHPGGGLPRPPWGRRHPASWPGIQGGQWAGHPPTHGPPRPPPRRRPTTGCHRPPSSQAARTAPCPPTPCSHPRMIGRPPCLTTTCPPLPGPAAGRRLLGSSCSTARPRPHGSPARRPRTPPCPRTHPSPRTPPCPGCWTGRSPVACLKPRQRPPSGDGSRGRRSGRRTAERTTGPSTPRLTGMTAGCPALQPRRGRAAVAAAAVAARGRGAWGGGRACVRHRRGAS